MVGSNSSDSCYMQPVEDETCTISQSRNETINHVASQVWNAYEVNKNIIIVYGNASISFLIKIPNYDDNLFKDLFHNYLKFGLRTTNSSNTATSKIFFRTIRILLPYISIVKIFIS